MLHECLLHPSVDQVLVVTRRPSGVSHVKLKEIVLDNFYDWTTIEHELQGYNACFFCLGVTSVGKTEEEYRRATYDLTMNAAAVLSRLNPDMVFTYVTGSSTDSTEKGRTMWARVKGKTENDLLRLPFRAAYMFRPGYIHPTEGLRNAHKYYSFLKWLYPLLRIVVPRHVVTLRQLGLAMIHAATAGYDRKVLECPDIIRLADGHSTAGGAK